MAVARSPRRLICLVAVVAIAGCSSSSSSDTAVRSTIATASSTSAVTTPSTSATTEPETSPAATTEPATSEPATSEPATTEPATTEPATSTTAAKVKWTGPCARPGESTTAYEHIIWIWMENKNTSEVLDSDKAPFLNGLAQQCGTATNYVDNGIHPSLPNYIAATSGDPQGIADDAPPSAHPLQADNLFRQLRAIGKSAVSYQEAMPAPCSLQSAGRYAVKHNPAAYYMNGDDGTACARDNVSFDHFATDLAAVSLPAFSFITPDLCNDTHDCPVATGDAWLAMVVDSITGSTTYRAGNTAVFIVYDESEGAGTMPFFAIAPNVVAGTRADTPLSHYSLLAFTEDALGITGHLGGAASAPSLAAAFGL